MTARVPHAQTILHLVPSNDRTKAVLDHLHNQPYVSSSKNGMLGLEIGYHVAATPCPETLVQVGRNADLILPGASISAVQFSFEVHPESKCIMFYDRSRHYTTKIDPLGFRGDGLFRQVVIQPNPNIMYRIGAGGINKDVYQFAIVWLNPVDVSKRIERDYLQASQRPQNPHLARTIDDTVTHLPTWYNTRLQTPSGGGVERFEVCDKIGEGAFGKVAKAVDIDSGCFVAMKAVIPSMNYPQERIRGEVKILSQLSHKNIVEYLGSQGWGTPTIHIFTSLKLGNVTTLFDAKPDLRRNEQALSPLLHQMLEALDYLSYRNLIHRDVKPDNILYTEVAHGYRFQLADFGLSRQARGAETFCGTQKYMAPELYRREPQTPKIDVWSLLISILDLMQVYDKSEPGQWLTVTKEAVKNYSDLTPMGEEDPSLRASAAQMLVKLFDGKGLTTPRAQVEIRPQSGQGKLHRVADPKKTGQGCSRVTKRSPQPNRRPGKQRQRDNPPKALRGINLEGSEASPAGYFVRQR